MSAVQPATTAIATRQVIRFSTFAEVCEVAKGLYFGGIAPKNVDRWEKLVPILIAGAELGLGCMASVKSITPPVNGICTLWGDAGLAMIRASGQLEKFDELLEGEGDARKAVCLIQRRGYGEKRFEYPLEKAKKLASYRGAYETKNGKPKGGPWFDDPDNMLAWRARWKAWRSEFTDILHGMGGAEEEEAITVEVVQVQTAPPVALPPAAPAVPLATDEQLTELKRLKGMLLANVGDVEKAAAEKWASYLAPFAVASALDLTEEQCAALIKIVGEDNDPFTYPNPNKPY